MASIIASTGGLVILLIVGCMSEQSRSEANVAPVTTAPQPKTVTLAVPQPAPTLPLTPAVSTVPKSSTHVAPPQATPHIADTLQTVYVVKPGDTLTRIARLYKTTIKSLQAANGLASDKIAIGMKLKLPPPTA